MTNYVARTCTEIADRDDPTGPKENHSSPLERFREADAYVLLGSPGSGKTTEFEREATIDGGCYVTARDFVSFDDKPEWHDATLYIDGLDEIRAGSNDQRTPFDNIRAKIDRLGRPRFRLSCREADWFGAHDTNNLKAVSPSGEVTVLQLDPLSNDAIRQILSDHMPARKIDAFVDTARERGIDALLATPQSLNMLVLAVQGNAGWPQTRMETFELACKALVREHNQEHRMSNRDTLGVANMLDTAGRLCAIQLLTGYAGYDVDGTDNGGNMLELVRISGPNQSTFQRVLGTKLFRVRQEGAATPIHRTISEFLGGRYLGSRIREGLPVGRVLSLISGHDGRIVAEMRGLSAWLAAWSKPSRGEIIKRDPLGTVLYGDAREFSIEEKQSILDGIRRQAIGDRQFLQTIRTATRLGDLATPDMDESLEATLSEPSRELEDQRYVWYLMNALQHGQPTPGHVEVMSRFVRDREWFDDIRCAAIEMLSREATQNSVANLELDALLEDANTGSVFDPDDELLGTLLKELFPLRLGVPGVLQYLHAPKNPSLYGTYFLFWSRLVAEKSTHGQLATLLDALVERHDEFRSAIERPLGTMNQFRHLPLMWLTSLLKSSQEDIGSGRLFNWLQLVSVQSTMSSEDEAEFMRAWLNSRPSVFKDIVTLSADHCSNETDFAGCMHEKLRRLFKAEWPTDSCSWCLEQALAAEDTRVATWYVERVATLIYNDQHDADFSRSEVETRLNGNSALKSAFATRLTTLLEHESSGVDTARELKAEVRKRQSDWRDYLSPQAESLRSNHGSPDLLHRLAQAYFGEFIDIRGDSPHERLEDLFGGDEGLIDAVLVGFQSSIRRSDVPTFTEILRLRAEKSMHLLAYPIMAGLEEASTNTSVGIFHNEEEIRLALAIHYAVPMPHRAVRPPSWFLPLLDSHPEIVADVLEQCVRSKITTGDDFRVDVYELAHSTNHARVAQEASLPLLKAFPVRSTEKQLSGLKNLLLAAIIYCEKGELVELIERKLSKRSMNIAQRVYWFTIACLVCPRTYLESFESYVSQNERRVRHLSSFLADEDIPATVFDRLNIQMTSTLVRLIGKSFRPSDFEPSMNVDRFIERLEAIPSEEATRALQKLLSDQDLWPWQSQLADAAYRQQSIRREAEFNHCDVEQVIEVLDNLRPANAADLASLTVEILRETATGIRDGNTSGWRKYWNVDRHNRPIGPKPEDACRDYLLDDLRLRTEHIGLDAQPEGQYANDKRSDIRVSHEGFNVPIEIKKSCHRGLWTAIRNQLIFKYSRDPGTSGYGIYLVFWFGDSEYCRLTPGNGPPPKSVEDLKNRLLNTLTDDETQKISVCVIDVSVPS